MKIFIFIKFEIVFLDIIYLFYFFKKEIGKKKNGKKLLI
jgi:hypothetical protein